ncbi:hypothetical protein M8J76_016626 [Diaphorina citri]|nr:hypothetical protein M8J76_016626 [Diaphorina citri]
MTSFSPWRHGLGSARLLFSTLLILLCRDVIASSSKSAEIETGAHHAAEDRIYFDQRQGSEAEQMEPDEPMQEESRQVPQYVRGSVVGSSELSDEELSVQRNAAAAAQQYVRGKSSNKYGKQNQHHAPQVQESEDISQPINVQFLDSDPAGSASIANRAVPNQFPANSGYSLDSARPSHAYADQGAYHGLDFKHHNYEKMTKFLRQTSSRYPNLTALYSIGKSVQGDHERIFDDQLMSKNL